MKILQAIDALVGENGTWTALEREAHNAIAELCPEFDGTGATVWIDGGNWSALYRARRGPLYLRKFAGRITWREKR